MKKVNGTNNNIDSVSSELVPNLDIKKEVTILFDGKQFMIKIPKEIAEFYKLKKGKKMKLVVKPKGEGKGENSFEIIK